MAGINLNLPIINNNESMGAGWKGERERERERERTRKVDLTVSFARLHSFSHLPFLMVTLQMRK